jgi:glycosyltransferase involved in cell wall biosynthesis
MRRSGAFGPSRPVEDLAVACHDDDLSIEGERFVFVLEQALGHVTHGRNIELVAAATPGIAPSVIRLRQSSSHWAGRVPLLSTWSFQASWSARSALRRRLTEGPVDALLFHTQVSALFSVREMRTVPTVISLDATAMNYDDFGYGHSRQGRVLERAKWELNRRAFGAAASVISFSRWAADSVVGDYGIPDHKVRVIRPGVDLLRFRPGTDRQRLGPPRVLFVGGDFSRKGGEDLLHAMKLLGGAAELDIVTESRPPSIPINSPVRVHVGLSHATEKLFELFRQADIFVLPARGECYGHVICEAMASGLPVVATNVGAIPEIVSDGESGLLIPPGSPSALAGAVRMLVERPDMRRSMGEQGLRLVRRDHDATRNIEAILELMTDLSGRHKRATTGRFDAANPALRFDGQRRLSRTGGPDRG